MAHASRQTPKDKLVGAYMDLVTQASLKYWRVCNWAYCVRHMIKPATALFHPMVVGAVLLMLISRALSAIPGLSLIQGLLRGGKGIGAENLPHRNG
eukprot:jgi/Botrbrau1/18664/Bobra.0854s0002.1